jgi:hypothetical protein
MSCCTVSQSFTITPQDNRGEISSVNLRAKHARRGVIHDDLPDRGAQHRREHAAVVFDSFYGFAGDAGADFCNEDGFGGWEVFIAGGVGGGVGEGEGGDLGGGAREDGDRICGVECEGGNAEEKDVGMHGCLGGSIKGKVGMGVVLDWCDLGLRKGRYVGVDAEGDGDGDGEIRHRLSHGQSTKRLDY